MKKRILMAISLSMAALGFSQETFDNIPLGEGYYLNKIIGSPPSVYITPGGELTTDDSSPNIRVSRELTLEYYEFRGTPNAIVPSDLYFVNIEGDGQGTSTDMGKVDEAIQLGDGVRTFGSNGLLAIVSNYTDENTGAITTNEYSDLLAGTGTTIITVELVGNDVDGTSSSNVSSATPNIGYDGNIEDFAVSYMLIQAPVTPKGHDLDLNDDGVIDATGAHTSWTLYDSMAYLDNDDQLDDNGGNDTGEYGYAQLIFARDIEDKPDSYKTTTSATVIPVSGGNTSFYLRQGLKTGATINDWIVAAVADGPFPNWTFSSNDSRVFPASFVDYSIPDAVFGALNPVEVNTWNGDTSTDWDDENNWELGFVPGQGDEVLVESTSNNPMIGSTTAAEAQVVTVDAAASLTIASGGSLIVEGSSTGDITYMVSTPDDRFRFYASPVSGETYDDAWITDNSIASGTLAANRGIATFSNAVTTGNWMFFQGGSSAENFDTGTGYSLKRTAAGSYSFIGSYPQLPVAIDVTQGAGSNWNLIGNTSPAYLNIADFIAANASNITDAFEAVYTYDGFSYTANTAGYIEPGQAFFINADATTTVNVTADMIGAVQTAAKDSEALVSLKVSNGTVTDATELVYTDDATLGLDPGKDLGKFDGVSADFSVYTELVSDNEGIAFAKQSVPNTDGAVIPVGVVAKSGEEVTFSVETVNLEGVSLYLEDKATGAFVDLSEGEYKTTLESDANGVGQFYIHTTAAKTLSNEDVINNLDAVSVYTSSSNELTITGLNGDVAVNVYSTLGTKVASSNITSGGVSTVTLPSLSTGVYLVNLQSDLGEVTKKIILE